MRVSCFRFKGLSITVLFCESASSSTLMRPRTILISLILSILCPSISASGGNCTTSLDCWLNGDCVSSGCVCDAAWDGGNCEVLSQLPGYQIWPNPLVPPPNNISQLASSWGATVVHSDVDGLWHGYFDVVCGNLTWMHVEGAVIVHATAKTIQGPYTFHDVALPQESINPHIVRASDGTWLLAHCRHPEQGVPQCTGNYSDADFGAFFPKTDPTRRKVFDPSACGKMNGVFSIASSSDLNGPWQIHDATIRANTPLPNPNPTLLPMPNSTQVYLGFTFPADGNEYIGLASAPTWDSDDYDLVGDLMLFDQQGEDAFLWHSQRGFHFVFHRFDDDVNVGGYAVSTDGKTWIGTPHGIYNLTVSFGDRGSTTFMRRERPEMLFNPDGSISALLTGVELYEDYGHSSLSILTPVRQSG
eukprot:TRINITY_DN1415_c0_g1_i2.p1 TRINITY_DN1415_c0_g1~~TRINITY_DN1415_c0_g1_i2.p1  ORF type:complete len:450 (-),score=126.67 TRINITY_DN1415_c0_g1_i2:113-1360(-)